MNQKITLCIVGLAALLQACNQSPPPVDPVTNAQPADTSVEQAASASTAAKTTPDAVYWGDTHLHTY